MLPGWAPLVRTRTSALNLRWQLLPLEPGFGSGQTHWRRLERWRQAGVLDRLHSSVRRAARGRGNRHKVRRSGKGYGSDPNRRDLRTTRRIPCVAG